MNLRQLRKKIRSINNVKKITHAMELVSAAKMKKSQQEAIESKPYQEMLEAVIKRISFALDPKFSDLLKENFAEKKLIILISSNKGLCGSFNYNLFSFLLKKISLEDLEKYEFISLGKKGSIFINQIKKSLVADFSSKKPILMVPAIIDFVLKKFLSKEYSEIFIVYNKFISAFKLEPTIEKLLPIKEINNQVEKLAEDYLIEPSPEKIIDSLLKNFIETKLNYAVISSEAGEHSARMMAMKNATENADELIYNLTLTSNKVRQEKITNELLDMITAKESVEVKN